MTSETDRIGAEYILKNIQTAINLQEAGIEVEKSWSACDDKQDCDICLRNQKAGWIPLDHPFPSGHQYPLAHDGCRCDIMTRVKDHSQPKKKTNNHSKITKKKKSGCCLSPSVAITGFLISIVLLLAHIL